RAPQARFPLPLWERVVRAEGEDRVRGFARIRLQATPHPARRSLVLATSHPLPQGERGSEYAARFRNNPARGEGKRVCCACIVKHPRRRSDLEVTRWAS